MRPHRGGDVVQVFVLALDLAENRIERMLERPVELVPLGRAQLVEVSVNPFAGLRTAFTVAAAEVFEDLLVRHDGLGNIVLHSSSRIGL